MKTVFNLTLVFAMLVTASISCLMIFEIFSVARGAELLFKSLAALVLLGATAAAIARIAAPGTTPGD